MEQGAEQYRRFLTGDDDGIVEIIRLYKDGLILYLNSFAGDIHTAEDITEEVFVKLVTKKPHFSGKSSFKTWLYTIARNAAFDYMRKNTKISDKPIEDYAELASEEADFEQKYLQKERELMLHNALKKLKTEYRQILYLTYFEGFTNSETAVVMKKSKRQIENLMYRAKKSLKAQLEKEGFVYEEL